MRLRSSDEHRIGLRPVLEARLEQEGRADLRVFVVHLEAGGEDSDVETRRAQLDELAPIVARAVAESNDEVVVLGDFNAAHARDRQQLRRFAALEAKGLCEQLGCDGGLICPVSRFLVSDHCPVLTEL